MFFCSSLVLLKTKKRRIKMIPTSYLMEVSQGVVIVDSRTISINYERPLEREILLEKYDFVHRSIFEEEVLSEDDLAKKSGLIDVYIICFDRAITSRGVMEEFQKMKVSPAGIRELVAISREYPHLQEEHQILALGQDFDWNEKEKYIPFIGFCENGGRFLSMTWSGHRWDRHKRFIAIA